MSTEYQYRFLKRKEIINETWNSFIRHSPQDSIYLDAQYLDCICPGWAAILIFDDNICMAVLPINISEKLFIKYSLRPCFSQFLGPAFSDEINDNKKAEIFELFMVLISENVKVYDHCLHPSLTDFPTTKIASWAVVEKYYTYELKLNFTVSELFNSFSSNIINHVKKAEKAGLVYIYSNTSEPLIQMAIDNRIINTRQSISFRKIWKYIASNNKGFILYAMDKDGIIHAGGAFIVNSDKVTFICSASDRNYRKLGGNSMIIWEAIKKSMSIPGVEKFDFEGSMLKNVETYFKGYHPTKIEYTHIYMNHLSKPFKYALMIMKDARKHYHSLLKNLHIPKNPIEI